MCEVKDAFVVASGLVKSYGAVRAVDGVDLALEARRVVGVAGPNGSGKSTMARMLLGFSSPDSGSVTVAGLTPAAYREAHGVGFVREDGARGWDRLTPRQLLSLRGDPDDATVRQVGEILKLASLMDRPIAGLSKGQWRTCQLWFALASSPRFLVLDEPDAGLDPAALDRLRIVVRSAADRGAAVLVLSHHLDEMALTADTVVFMAHGRVRGAVDPRGKTATELRADYRRLVEDA
ncbi:MAG: ABC transporter ATP-binding protein [Gemmatimonadetes bacterium]|nr:ABC transporter ATP-binding protein [Gemmatimonadota bacterium]